MSGFITQAGENYLLELLTGDRAAHPYYYVSLIVNNPPTRFIAGGELDEPVGGGYERAAMVNATGNWTERVQFVSNSIQVEFNAATTEWGRIKYWGICDQPIGGNLLWAGQFIIPPTIRVADKAIIPPGSLVIRSIGYSETASLRSL